MTPITLSETGRITLPVRMLRKLRWEPGMRLHILMRDDEIAVRGDIRFEDLGGIMGEYAIPGTTHEQERESMYEYIADVHRKKQMRIERDFRERKKQESG